MSGSKYPVEMEHTVLVTGSLAIKYNKGVAGYLNHPAWLLLVARRGDLAVSTRNMTEEAAVVGTGPDWQDQRKEKNRESLKTGKVVPTGPAQRVGSGGVGRILE